MELDHLYKLRLEFVEAQREQCVCVSNRSYEHRCWGCGYCWHCVDIASDHHCIECCKDDFVAAKAAWERRTRPSVECLMRLPNGHYSALVVACHQAEVAYKVLNPSVEGNVIRDAIRWVLIKSGLAYDNDHARELAEKVRLVLNTIKHDRRTGEEIISGDQDETTKETIRIARRNHIGLLSTYESSSIINGETQRPYEREFQLGLPSVVCELYKGLNIIFSDERIGRNNV